MSEPATPVSATAARAPRVSQRRPSGGAGWASAIERRLRVGVALALAALASACGGGGGPAAPTTPSTPGPALPPVAIMGASRLTAGQIVAWFGGRQPQPSGSYAATESVEALARYFVEEGAMEGVTGDVAFVQSIIETGWFRFGGSVPPWKNNFAGIGAVDASPGGAAAFPGARLFRVEFSRSPMMIIQAGPRGSLCLRVMIIPAGRSILPVREGRRR